MTCPRCHRPLEDDEDYICCADAALLRWRCDRCAKVTEGLAFPYGGCPYCGGQLQLQETDTAPEDAEAIAAVRRAFEIELGGLAFYRRAAGDRGDLELRSLFARLAAMEEEHMATLARRYHVDPPAAPGEFVYELAAVFGGVEHRAEDPGNLLHIAVAFEQRAAAYFDDCARRQPAGSPAQRLYHELAAEEREHAEMLATERARWRAGKPGLLGQPENAS